MRKFTLLIALTLVFQTFGFSQSCLPEGITFETQSQIDNFQVNYPNCTEIEGDVIISGEDIFNLDELSILTSINGNLSIGSLEYGGNPSLASLSGLNNLLNIGGTLLIFDNNLLTSLMGLNGLTTVEGLSIGFVPLTSLSGLESLISIEGDLEISALGLLTNFSGIESLTNIEGSLHISSNNSLSTLIGMESLTNIGGTIEIRNNPNLLSINSIENINPESIEHLFIHDNPLLSGCHIQNICDYLSAPNGEVVIHNNALGCSNPGEIAMNCGFTMPCLPFGAYFFTSQADIDNFPIYFPGCTDLAGSVYIEGDEIVNLLGLSSITSIENGLHLYHINNLASVDGLQNLSTIGEDLKIKQNESLTDLIGLNNLTSINGWLEIYDNNSLTTLSGLDNINNESIEVLIISHNPLLSECDIQSICDYLAVPNGSINIYDNAPGCNSQQEVEEACEAVYIYENNPKYNFLIYPNPATNEIFIQSNSSIKTTDINIYNTIGQVVLQEKQPFDKIDISRLSRGLYFIELVSNEIRIREKLIVN